MNEMNGNEQMNIMINERDEQHHYWTLTCDDDGMNVNNSNGDMAIYIFQNVRNLKKRRFARFGPQGTFLDKIDFEKNIKFPS